MEETFSHPRVGGGAQLGGGLRNTLALVQDLDEIDLGVQDSALEVVCEKQIAAAAYMKDRLCQLTELDVHKIRHRIILHETTSLHLHPEGVHLGQILIIGCSYHIHEIPGQAGDDNSLSNLSTVAESFLRCDETHLAVVLASHQDHSLGLDATDLAWSKVGKDTYLLSYHIFRSILFCNT